jgi:hypothetical protein
VCTYWIIPRKLFSLRLPSRIMLGRGPKCLFIFWQSPFTSLYDIFTIVKDLEVVGSPPSLCVHVGSPSNVCQKSICVCGASNRCTPQILAKMYMSVECKDSNKCPNLFLVKTYIPMQRMQQRSSLSTNFKIITSDPPIVVLCPQIGPSSALRQSSPKS